MVDLPFDDLPVVVAALLVEASGELFGGTPPAVAVELDEETLTFPPGPRPGPVDVGRESRAEDVPFDPQHPFGPYRLAASPAPGRRGVRLVVGDTAAVALRDEEVVWAADDVRAFDLAPLPHRAFTGVTRLRVDYAVDAVATALLGTGRTVATLTGPAALVERARDLALAVLTLDAARLRGHVRVVRQEGDVRSTRRLTELSVASVETVRADADAICRVTLAVSVSLAVERALRDGEGAAITAIRTPGVTGAGRVVVEPVVGVVGVAD